MAEYEIKREENRATASGISPKGVFKYPHLTSVDYGTKEFPKEDGEFNVKLVLDADTAEQFRADLQELLDAADELGKEADKKRKPANRKKAPYTLAEIGNPVYDENDEETGEIEINFKTKASGKSKKTGKKWTKTMAIYAASGKIVKNPPAIWGGTVGKLDFTAATYFVAATGQAGVAFYLNGVQVLELVSASAGSSNFGAEDGYDDIESSEEETSGGFSAEEGTDIKDNDGSEDF